MWESKGAARTRTDGPATVVWARAKGKTALEQAAHVHTTLRVGGQDTAPGLSSCTVSCKSPGTRPSLQLNCRNCPSSVNRTLVTARLTELGSRPHTSQRRTATHETRWAPCTAHNKAATHASTPHSHPQDTLNTARCTQQARAAREGSLPRRGVHAAAGLPDRRRIGSRTRNNTPRVPHHFTLRRGSAARLPREPRAPHASAGLRQQPRARALHRATATGHAPR